MAISALLPYEAAHPTRISRLLKLPGMHQPNKVQRNLAMHSPARFSGDWFVLPFSHRWGRNYAKFGKTWANHPHSWACLGFQIYYIYIFIHQIMVHRKKKYKNSKIYNNQKRKQKQTICIIGCFETAAT